MQYVKKYTYETCSIFNISSGKLFFTRIFTNTIFGIIINKKIRVNETCSIFESRPETFSLREFSLIPFGIREISRKFCVPATRGASSRTRRTIITARRSCTSSGRIQCVISSAAYPLSEVTTPRRIGSRTTGFETRIGLNWKRHPKHKAELLKFF